MELRLRIRAAGHRRWVIALLFRMEGWGSYGLWVQSRGGGGRKLDGAAVVRALSCPSGWSRSPSRCEGYMGTLVLALASKRSSQLRLTCNTALISESSPIHVHI